MNLLDSISSLHRYKLKEHRRHGEAASVDLNQVATEKIRMRRILARFAMRDRFNVDETSFFPNAPQWFSSGSRIITSLLVRLMRLEDSWFLGVFADCSGFQSLRGRHRITEERKCPRTLVWLHYALICGQLWPSDVRIMNLNALLNNFQQLIALFSEQWFFLQRTMEFSLAKGVISTTQASVVWNINPKVYSIFRITV